MDTSALISYLSGGTSASESAGLDSEKIFRSLRKSVAPSSDFLTLLKNEMLAKAAIAQKIGEMK